MNLEDVIIQDNIASATYGGGLYIETSTLIYNGGEIVNNECSGGLYADGGGMFIWNDSDVILNNVLFVGNSATSEGGGISNLTSSVTLNNVTMTENHADIQGGAIYNKGTLNIVNSIIFDICISISIRII